MQTLAQTFLPEPLVLSLSHTPFHWLSQFFILIAEWTVHYQHVSDPLVSEGCTVMLRETKKWGNSFGTEWISKDICGKERMGCCRGSWRSSYHRSFCDGPKAVNENITGDIHRWTWREKKQDCSQTSFPQHSSDHNANKLLWKTHIWCGLLHHLSHLFSFTILWILRQLL